MEEKILIHRNERTIKDTINLHNRVKASLQKIVDALKEMGIEPTLSLVVSAVRFDGKSTDIEKILGGIMYNEVRKIPALKVTIENKYSEYTDKIKELGIKADNLICNYERNDFYNPNPVKLTRFILENDIVSITPEGLEEITDESSIYSDSKSRNEILEKANAVIEAVKVLQESIDTVHKKKLSQYTNLQAIIPSRNIGISILAVDDDGNVTIKKENFDFIV